METKYFDYQEIEEILKKQGKNNPVYTKDGVNFEADWYCNYEDDSIEYLNHINVNVDPEVFGIVDEHPGVFDPLIIDADAAIIYYNTPENISLSEIAEKLNYDCKIVFNDECFYKPKHPIKQIVEYDSDNQLFIVEKNGKYGFIKISGEEITPLIYDFYVIYRGFATVRKGNRVGHLFFHEGTKEPLAYRTVEIYEIVKEGEGYGIANSFGKTIIPPRYSFIRIYNELIVTRSIFSRECYLYKPSGELLFDNSFEDILLTDYFKFQWLVVVKQAGKWGIVSIDGHWLVPPIIDNKNDIDIPYGNDQYAICTINNKQGLYNLTGKLTVPFEYDSIESSFKVSFVRKNDNRGFANTDKNNVIPCTCDSTDIPDCFDMFKQFNNLVSIVNSYKCKEEKSKAIKWYLLAAAVYTVDGITDRSCLEGSLLLTLIHYFLNEKYGPNYSLACLFIERYHMITNEDFFKDDNRQIIIPFANFLFEKRDYHSASKMYLRFINNDLKGLTDNIKMIDIGINYDTNESQLILTASRLGFMYYTGKGVDMNIETGLELLKLAASYENTQAQKFLEIRDNKKNLKQLIAYTENGKWGYRDKETNEILIPALYDEVRPSAEKIAEDNKTDTQYYDVVQVKFEGKWDIRSIDNEERPIIYDIILN